ncbi:DUF2474 domain-containing protein [Methylorubrum thiocyanatum]|uniref:Cell division septal protein FtsQ n=1 Tax=Methylorubrum thiocyanatum TaxID=47958 RepID=A0AA40VBP1_9HYPH|nr:DUF2474 domain-containing protein [Methylorubrum thiocyanatum]MBA8914127.1 cell division septal protein FtsQ [Methylorubrum thiocyanatum]GJE79092.1 hypothetical protein CJNNKLLH_0417 [Methylorubrum thiocyanatum]
MRHRHKPERAQGVAARLGWFVLLWLGGVASVAGVALLLRFVAQT